VSRTRRTTLGLLLGALLTTQARGASAEEKAAAAQAAPSSQGSEERPDVQTADGADNCAAFQIKNQKELHLWESTQPPVPYQYPRTKLFMNAPWAQFFSSLGHAGELAMATIFPHVGAQFRGDAPAAYVGWPWSVLVFGPEYSCSRKFNTFVVHGHRGHRLLLEPAVVSSKLGVGFSVRPGYRFIWHPSSWVVGPGLGLGSTVEIAGNQEPFRASISPEAVAHFGNCCASSYFTLAARYDHYFKGLNRDIVGATLGYTFF
jgi:hypothetical protein